MVGIYINSVKYSICSTHHFALNTTLFLSWCALLVIFLYAMLIVGRDLKGRKKEWWHQDKFLKPWTIKQTSSRIEITLQSHIERMRRDVNFKVNNNLGFSAMFQFGPRNSIISTSWHHTHKARFMTDKIVAHLKKTNRKWTRVIVRDQFD
jgi:hypothetical protein